MGASKEDWQEGEDGWKEEADRRDKKDREFGINVSFQNVIDAGNEQTEFDTGAKREIIEGKGRYDLLPPCAIDRLARHYENGAKKYSSRNWEKGLPLRTFLDSGLRHFFQLLDGSTKEDHAAAVMWNIAGFMWTVEQIKLCKCDL